MSYCRWSSDNSKCDIYAYESDQGFMIHVATSKLVGEPPTADIFGDKDTYISQSRVRSAWMDKAEYEPIGLPFDGETYTLETIEDFCDKMKELKAAGYHIPDGVIESIEEEIKAQRKTTPGRL